MAFTDYQLARIKPNLQQRRVLTETGVSPDLRGLQFWVSPSGSKTFVMRYKVDGRTRYLKIGAYPSLSLAQAHRQVQDYRAMLRDGIDPVERQEARKAASKAAPTMQLLYEDFRDHYLRRNRKHAADAEGVLELHVIGREQRGRLRAIDGWGPRKAASITRREIIERVREIEEAGTPRVAAVVKALLTQMFGYAVDTGLLDTSPAVRIPMIGSRGEERERILADEEIRTVWGKLDSARMLPQIRLALRLLLLTGQRRQEVALARWEHIDREKVSGGFRRRTARTVVHTMFRCRHWRSTFSTNWRRSGGAGAMKALSFSLRSWCRRVCWTTSLSRRKQSPVLCTTPKSTSTCRGGRRTICAGLLRAACPRWGCRVCTSPRCSTTPTTP